MPVLDHYPPMKKPAHFDPSRLQADEIKLFQPLIMEPKDLVGYLRTGGCTAGCGACCTAFVVPLHIEGLEDDDFVPVVHGQIILPIDFVTQNKEGYADWEYWLTLHGVYLFQMPSSLVTAAVPIQAEEPPGVMTFDGWVAWLEKHGITLLNRHGQVLAYVSIRCVELTEDGMCGLIGTPKRPKMCAPYPKHPLDVEGIDFCTYKFQPVQRDQIITSKQAKPSQLKARPKRKKKGRKKGGRRNRR